MKCEERFVDECYIVILWQQENSLSTLQAVMSAFEFLQKIFKASLFSAGK